MIPLNEISWHLLEKERMMIYNAYNFHMLLTFSVKVYSQRFPNYRKKKFHDILQFWNINAFNKVAYYPIFYISCIANNYYYYYYYYYYFSWRSRTNSRLVRMGHYLLRHTCVCLWRSYPSGSRNLDRHNKWYNYRMKKFPLDSMVKNVMKLFTFQ